MPKRSHGPLRGAQTSFEPQQMPDETRAAFETITSTRSEINNAQRKRVVLAKEYSSKDLAEYDYSVRETGDALAELERLVEPARIDLQHNDGKIKARTRLIWAVKESKNLSIINDGLRFARSQMKEHMKRPPQRVEEASVSLEDNPRPMYTTRNRASRGTVKHRQRSDAGRFARTRSVGSLDEDENIFHLRTVPRTRTTTIPALTRQKEEFDVLLLQHEQARPSPPMGPLGQLLASVEARNEKQNPIFQSGWDLHEEFIPAAPAQPVDFNPSVSLLGLNMIPEMRTNNSHSRQRFAISPPITPPDSPFQILTNLPLPMTSELGTLTDGLAEFPSVMNLDRLPTVPEAPSIRFELDATQPVRTSQTLGPPQALFRDIPPSPSVRPIERKALPPQAVLSQDHRAMVLPYPDDQARSPNVPVSAEQRASPHTTSTVQAAEKTATELESTPHFFAGHRQPVNIRWKLESRKGTKNDSIKPSVNVSQSPTNKPQNSALDFMYQPYRPVWLENQGR